jgi:hypothetical protein
VFYFKTAMIGLFSVKMPSAITLKNVFPTFTVDEEPGGLFPQVINLPEVVVLIPPHWIE